MNIMNNKRWGFRTNRNGDPGEAAHAGSGGYLYMGTVTVRS